jgi:uncharacterized glyoxalase superfamily protein PhnB
MSQATTTLPQRLFAVTLASNEIAKQRSFYESWGWQALPYSNAEYAAFDLNGVVVAFFTSDKLAAEAAPGELAPGASGYKGVTLAVSLPKREDVDRVWQNAVAAGARAVGHPEDRPWGGRSGYIADPEGNRWEIAWVPPMGEASN